MLEHASLDVVCGYAGSAELTLSLHRVSQLWAFKLACLSIQVWTWFVVMLVLQNLPYTTLSLH